MAWIGIGLDLLAFNAIPATYSLVTTPIGYLIAALGLTATSTIFRRASLLAGFFDSREIRLKHLPASPLIKIDNAKKPFTRKFDLGEDSFSGRKFLLEVDSNSRYENIINDFASELLSLEYSVFVFTAKGSPIHNALRPGRSRFYLLSTAVSYTTGSTVPTEVLVPQSDPAVLLDALQKTIDGDSISPIGLIFDSISDFILTMGLQTSYRFLKKVLEAIDSDRVTALFLMTAGAHDARQSSLVKSLFANQLMVGAKGLEVKRLA